MGMIIDGIDGAYDPATHKLAGYEADTTNIDPSNTVEGRLSSITSKDGLLMQDADTRAKQSSNKSGLLNTSMAQGARELSVVRSALPIAQQDSSQNLQNDQFNAASNNTAYGFNAASLNQASNLYVAGEQAKDQIGLQGEESRKNITAQGRVESALIAERGEIDKQLQTADGEIRENLLNRKGEIDKELVGLQGDQQRLNITAQGDVESELIAERGEIDKQLQTADGVIRENLLDRQGEIDAELAAAEFENNKVLQKSEQDFNAALQVMRGDQAVALEEIQAGSALLRQSSQNASIFYSQITANIAEIANSEMSAQSKQILINKQTQMLASGLSIIGKMGNIDNLEDLLTFTDTSGLSNDYSSQYNNDGGVVVNTGGNGGNNNAGNNNAGNNNDGNSEEQEARDGDDDGDNIVDNGNGNDNNNNNNSDGNSNFDSRSYLDANLDIEIDYENKKYQGNPPNRLVDLYPTVEDYAVFHYEEYGRSENRLLAIDSGVSDTDDSASDIDNSASDTDSNDATDIPDTTSVDAKRVISAIEASKYITPGDQTKIDSINDLRNLGWTDEQIINLAVEYDGGDPAMYAQEIARLFP